MQLETLIKKREAYAGQILRLGIQIAGIFLIPVILVIIISRLFDISLMYLFPFAFITSWASVIVLYRKVSREVRYLDAQIKEARAMEKEQNNDAAHALQK